MGGVGINLAIQDAVAAARILTQRKHRGPQNSRTLARVQRRRMLPTVMTQLGQQMAHRFFVERVLGGDTPLRAPLPLRLLNLLPSLQTVPARLVGVGVRLEHVSRSARNLN